MRLSELNAQSIGYGGTVYKARYCETRMQAMTNPRDMVRLELTREEHEELIRLLVAFRASEAADSKSRLRRATDTVMAALDRKPTDSWTAITEAASTLPPVGELVCLSFDNGSATIGCREYDDTAEGWLWSTIHGPPEYWPGHQQWGSYDLEFDDLHPTHWHPLPKPPAKEE